MLNKRLSPQSTLAALRHLLLRGTHDRIRGGAAAGLAAAAARAQRGGSLGEDAQAQFVAEATFVLLAVLADEATHEVQTGADNPYARRGAGVACSAATALGMMLGSARSLRMRSGNGFARRAHVPDHVCAAVRALRRELTRVDSSHALRFDCCLALARIGSAARSAASAGVLTAAREALQFARAHVPARCAASGEHSDCSCHIPGQMDEFTDEIAARILLRWSVDCDEPCRP